MVNYRCSNCKGTIEPNWKLCPNCGTKIPKGKFEELKSKIYVGKQVGSNTKKKIGVIVVGALILSIAVSIMPTAGKYYKEGLSLYEQNNYDKAIEKFEKSLELNPNHKDAKYYLRVSWTNKGNALFKQGKYSEALTCFDKAIALDSNWANQWYYKGEALRVLLKYSEALTCYDKAIALEPNWANLWNAKAFALEGLVVEICPDIKE